MRIYKILSKIDKSMVYGGEFASFRACVEAAASQGVDLGNAQLSRLDLRNISLDDARINNADFRHANLTGANLSEAVLAGTDFSGATLYGACLAYSDLAGCVFDGAFFGGTDIVGADISGARFNGVSCFSLEFFRTRAMRNCRFVTPGGEEFISSRPPIVINGVRHAPVVVKAEKDLYLKRQDAVSLRKAG